MHLDQPHKSIVIGGIEWPVQDSKDVGPAGAARLAPFLHLAPEQTCGFTPDFRGGAFFIRALPDLAV